MTKRELIDEILEMNRSADPQFLASFEDGELNEYLEHLRRVKNPRKNKAAYSLPLFDRLPRSCVEPDVPGKYVSHTPQTVKNEGELVS